MDNEGCIVKGKTGKGRHAVCKGVRENVYACAIDKGD